MLAVIWIQQGNIPHWPLYSNTVVINNWDIFCSKRILFCSQALGCCNVQNFQSKLLIDSESWLKIVLKLQFSSRHVRVIREQWCLPQQCCSTVIKQGRRQARAEFCVLETFTALCWQWHNMIKPSLHNRPFKMWLVHLVKT